jgi:hypothetical protein
MSVNEGGFIRKNEEKTDVLNPSLIPAEAAVKYSLSETNTKPN